MADIDATPNAKLKNEDFRRLLSSVRSERTSSNFAPPTSYGLEHSNTLAPPDSKPNKSNGKKPPKKYFRPPIIKEKAAKTEVETIFDESEERLREILLKYRDRAAERRKGNDKEDFDEADVRMKLAGGFKAVPRTAAAAMSKEEKRKMAIEESKYLGGDMEHTHLVKGLDYSLLNKVRSEIVNKEDENDEDDMAELADSKIIPAPEKITDHKLARSICKTLFHSQPPQRNEYFGRGRMAYVVEVDDEEAEVPTTLIRSVHECPEDKSSENMNTDNMLIQKLTQVLSYLRSDTKKKKKQDGDEVAVKKEPTSNHNIYDNIGDYAPTKSKEEKREKEKARESREDKERRDRDKPGSYFDSKPNDDRRNDRERDRDRDRERRDRDRRDRDERRDRDRDRDDRRGRREDEDRKREAPSAKEDPNKKKRRLDEEDAYAELYPMAMGMFDGGGESDEDADYSKMDMGNRKGPVKRWDFDTAEEYERYQSGREALPKAAFQYGVKTSGGRKTRKTENQKKNEERKIDRELEKINKIWDNKKQGTTDMNKLRY